MQIQLKDFCMAYNDVGKGLPLLLIHGYPLNRQMWEPQLAGLADVARVLAPDLRGHGDSQATPGPYPMHLFADDLAAFLDALEIDQPVIICGLSMGGYAAFAFQRRYATRMCGLILTATRPTPDTAQAQVGRDQAAILACEEGVGAIVEGLLPRLIAPQSAAQNPELATRLKTIMGHTSLDGVLGDLAGMKTRPDSTPDLVHITVPTLVIHGEQDAIVPLEEARAMTQAIPGAHLEIIQQAGHLPNLENPPVFNQAVRQFIATLR